jgi:hypothetical protein
VYAEVVPSYVYPAQLGVVLLVETGIHVSIFDYNKIAELAFGRVGGDFVDFAIFVSTVHFGI